MKYKIDIFSKEECINFSNKTLEEDCVIVSINDTGHTTNFHKNKHIKDILSLTFDDLTFDIDGYILFNKSMGEEIKYFVDNYKQNINHFIVHCTAGISRSAAVGFIITKYLNGDDSCLFRKGRYVPNKLIYEIMSNIFGLVYNEEDFNDKLNLKYSRKINRNSEIKFDEDFCDIIIK